MTITPDDLLWVLKEYAGLFPIAFVSGIVMRWLDVAITVSRSRVGITRSTHDWKMETLASSVCLTAGIALTTRMNADPFPFLFVLKLFFCLTVFTAAMLGGIAGHFLQRLIKHFLRSRKRNKS